MDRILIIRGGAIGDFILTLPALKALRDAFPQTRLEILGYSHIAELARERFYAAAVRSIEYAPLSRFFARQTDDLPSDLADYFSSFDVIVSYLYDSDGIFTTNLERCGVLDIVRGPAKLEKAMHAALQLAKPMKQFGLEVTDLAPRVYPSAEDRRFAREFLRDMAPPVVAFHPGSGSEKKNWPIEKWTELGDQVLNATNGTILIISGEADEKVAEKLRKHWSAKQPRIRFAHALPLPQLGAVLENNFFIGHDSGISHLAAAAGANCISLFGPTDPAIWAPQGPNVTVLRTPNCDLSNLSVENVSGVLGARLRNERSAVS